MRKARATVNFVVNEFILTCPITRALVTFRKLGIAATPASTEVRIVDDPIDPLDFLPDAGARAGTSDAMREAFGYLVYSMRGDI